MPGLARTSELTKVVVGLGNPGSRYQQTRHNVGAAVVQELMRRKSARPARDGLAMAARATIAGTEVALAYPRTFMNDCGPAVQSLVHRHGVRDLEDLLVVVDDMDLALGTLRLRPSGSDAGHNGLKSIIEALGSRGFARLRVGIGRPVPGLDPIDHVLGRFSSQEKPTIAESQLAAADAVESWIAHGITETMNQFNRTPANDVSQ